MKKIFAGIFAIGLLLQGCAQKEMNWDTYSPSVWEKISDGHQFCEGPAFDGQDSLYVSNCKGGTIDLIVGLEKTEFLAADAFPEIHERTNGLTVGADGYLYACEYGKDKGGIIRLDSEGNAEVYAGEFEGESFSRPNDLAFDSNGNLYFTNPKTYNAKKPDGHVYRVDRGTLEVTQAAGPFSFPNGIAFSADAKKVYVAESAKNQVLVFDVSENGSLLNQQVFAELPGGDPDGIALDENGNVYVAHFGGGNVVVFDSDGNLLSKIPTPGKKPSNIEFIDHDLGRLVVTEDETNSVYVMNAPINGEPLHFHPMSK